MKKKIKNSMMKKITTAALAGVMAFSPAACQSIMGAETASAAEAADAEESTDILVGGWEVNAGDVSMDSNPEAKEAFEKATADIVGYEYEAVALLGTQVVAGTNYSILARGRAVVPDAEPEFLLVTIYEDLEGNAEILDTKTIVSGTAIEEETEAADTES